MRRFFVFLGVVLMTAGSAVSAQEADSTAPVQKSSWGDAKTEELLDYIPEVSLDTRFGYNHIFSEQFGALKGDGLYLNIDGNISPHLSYSIQYRIASTYYEDNYGFNALSWLNLTYSTGDFEFTLGKDALLLGNFEFDVDDFDSYYDMNSMFYNMFDSYQWAFTAAWYPEDAHGIYIQAAESPFRFPERTMFSYTLGWSCETEHYESYYSASLWEYEPGKFVKSLNLGNRFIFGDFSLDLDYMTRSTRFIGLFSDDFTLTASPSYEIGDFCRVFGKFGWERTASELPYELAYEDYMGTDYLFYGLGAEFYPIRDYDNLRLFAAWAANNQGENFLNIGLRWRLDLTSTTKKLIQKLNR